MLQFIFRLHNSCTMQLLEWMIETPYFVHSIWAVLRHLGIGDTPAGLNLTLWRV